MNLTTPPLSGPLPVDDRKLAQWTKPWSNWLTAVWQQITYLFTSVATVSTTDGTATTLATITIPPTTTMMIIAEVTARRTGGVAGTAEDGAAYIVAAAYKNVAGTATEIGETAMFTAEDQAGWACTFTASGANALLRVTGAADNNVNWRVQYRTGFIS
jgi:hypothetical protein